MNSRSSLALGLSAALAACASSPELQRPAAAPVPAAHATAGQRYAGAIHKALLVMAAFGGANPHAMDSRTIASGPGAALGQPFQPPVPLESSQAPAGVWRPDAAAMPER